MSNVTRMGESKFEQFLSPEGTYEKSPTLQCWEPEPQRDRPEGTAERTL
jgi:hypothetical protein